jgi:hypothetical protein
MLRSVTKKVVSVFVRFRAPLQYGWQCDSLFSKDGSYWRKIVRNKMVRMKEVRREKAAKSHGPRQLLKNEEAVRLRGDLTLPLLVLPRRPECRASPLLPPNENYEALL